MERKPIKYRVTCGNCGEAQMFYNHKKVRRPYSSAHVSILECEVCGHTQEIPEGAEPASPVLSKAASNEDADEALKAIYGATQVLIDHAETSGTVFCGVVTVDRGGGDLGAGDFFIGKPYDISAAFKRLFVFRPELIPILEHAIATYAIDCVVVGYQPEGDLRGVKVYLDNIAADPSLLDAQFKARKTGEYSYEVAGATPEECANNLLDFMRRPKERDTFSDPDACPRCGTSTPMKNGECWNCGYGIDPFPPGGAKSEITE